MDDTIVSMVAGNVLVVYGIRWWGTSDSRKPFSATFMRNILSCLVKIYPHADALFNFNLRSLLFSVTFLRRADCFMASVAAVGKGGNTI